MKRLDASPTQWIWIRINSGGWWWTGKPDMLQSMWLQRVRHNWVNELNWAKKWIFIGRTAEPPIFWPPDVKSWLTGKDPDPGKDGRQMRTGQQSIRWLDSITNTKTWIWTSLGRWWRQRSLACPLSMGLQRVWHDFRMGQPQGKLGVKTKPKSMNICISTTYSIWG